MGVLWTVLFVALTGSQLGQGSPVRSTPQVYPHDTPGPALDGWGSEGGLYAAIPALALVIAAVGLLFGCTWCYRHKDCKPNEGADNQLFTASATHLHDARRSQPPDSGFSEPVNNNISEDNNNGPISLREMQNIANNNAAAYIISENEERNRVSRESVVEFEPLPSGIRVADPLEHCADWFDGEDFQRNRLQYLREIGRGWFGRVVEGEIESEGATSSVAVKILNQNASLEDKARFLDEARVYRDVQHDNILAFVSKCLDEDPWILMFELCSMDLQQYLVVNRAKMAILNESGVPLQLMCDVSSALAYLHSHSYLYGNLSSENVLVRNATESPRAVLGNYATSELHHEFTAPETRAHPPVHTSRSEVWSLGTVIWEVCAWGGELPAPGTYPPPPDLPCPYRNHLYQVMQLCWERDPQLRPSSQQVHALLTHLHTTHCERSPNLHQGYGTTDFEERWQRLKPNSIPKIDEHVAIVHAPSTSMASHFTGSEESHPQDTLSVDMDTAVSRSSSIMSDKDALSVLIKSESLTNLHGSLEDVRNIYLTHNETAILECHQGNISFEDSREKEQDRSDSSVDPWLKDIMAGSQDDVSYYKDVSDVIKNLDNILNSEKTSSSESSHQASPSRDNLSLDCKKEYPIQSSLVKSPGISNFQKITAMGFDAKEPCEDDEADRDTIGTLSHSFERHSDTISQHTLENLTPDTPIKDIDIFCKENETEHVSNDIIVDIERNEDTELPNEVECSDSIPKLKDLCVASLSSVSVNEQLNLRDCETLCDNNLAEIVRTDTQVNTKSIDNIIENAEELKNEPEEITETLIDKTKAPEILNSVNNVLEANSVEDIILPKTEDETVTNKIISEIISTDLEPLPNMEQEEVFALKTSSEPDVVSLKSTDILTDLISLDLATNSNDVKTSENVEAKETVEISKSIDKLEEELPSSPIRTPEPVQNVDSESETQNVETEKAEKLILSEVKIEPELSPGIVQNTNELPIESTKIDITHEHVNELNENAIEGDNSTQSDDKEETNNSTAYMDLINNTNSEIMNNSEILEDTLEDNVKDLIQSCLEQTPNETNCSLVKNESTVYLDLPSMLRATDSFLQSERVVSSQHIEAKAICASTPKGSDGSANNTLESSAKVNETDLSETKVPDCAASLTKFEVPESISPFESPTKSHHTDTYDENSSVVLGPFENCNIELFKNKSDVDLPKEELLAFSSNFSEINLETPSPLRDGNFLNEVPDIVHDEFRFDDVTVSESKPERTSDTDETDQSATAKHVSPSTPPNSPGIFLASTSQQKYLVDIDLEHPETSSYPPIECDSGLSSLQKEIDLNQIELQITSKLAMAENENNLNIEYSGPLTVEGLVTEEAEIVRDSDAMPESLLAGNGGSVEELRVFTLDEECVAALRSELELKLPLAQVASIEPACDTDVEWTELPPPPELVVSYCGGALSPIAEETKHQLSAYERDAWNTSTRTESSESYPEPCNLSTDEVTDLPTGGGDRSTYTLQSTPSPNHTYTVQKDIPSSKEITMSADSLNGSPYKRPADDQSPIDDTTYNKNVDEKESNCERISQVSPFLVSPVTDSAPADSGTDNATGISTLSKTTDANTVPTDAKLSKPSECLSKATSIDSWCSNDTLYNVEENFDDLAMDSDVPDIEPEKEDKSESTDTLTHNEDDKELSHCSTYIVHESKSDASETFSPDSITANDNYTYTKVKTEAATTPSVITKSDVNDSTKSHTKDLAYGTLPSYSNCTTELISGIEDPWRFPQPELVRRSPVNEEVFTPPKIPEVKEIVNDSPLTSDPCIKKMDSVDISCLDYDLIDSDTKSGCNETGLLVDLYDSPKDNYRSMAPSVTSTPLTEPVEENNGEPILMNLPDMKSPEYLQSIPNFQTFIQSAEIRPQDLSSNASNELVSTNQDTDLLLEGESKTLSGNNNKDSMIVSERTPTYSDFENSAFSKPQENSVRNKTNLSSESGMSSGDFGLFENSARSRPQDLSPVNDVNALLNSERQASDLVMVSSQSGTSHSSKVIDTVVSPSKQESQVIDGIVNIVVTDYDEEDTDQPHSIIITETDIVKESPNKTFNINTEMDIVEDSPNSIYTINTETDIFKESPNSIFTINTETDIVKKSPNSIFTINTETDIVNESPNSIFTINPETDIFKESPNSIFTINTETDIVKESPNSIFTINTETDIVNESPNSIFTINPETDIIKESLNSSFTINSETDIVKESPNSIFTINPETDIVMESLNRSFTINPEMDIVKESPNRTSIIDTETDIVKESPNRISIIETERDIVKESPNRTFDSDSFTPKTPETNDVPNESKQSLNMTFDSHENQTVDLLYQTFDSHTRVRQSMDNINEYNSETPEQSIVNGLYEDQMSPKLEETISRKHEYNDDDDVYVKEETSKKELKTTNETEVATTQNHKDPPNGSVSHDLINTDEIKCNGNSQNYATVNFLNETFEELMESNVDEDNKSFGKDLTSKPESVELIDSQNKTVMKRTQNATSQVEENGTEEKVLEATDHFLQNEKKFCQLDYLPMLSDIRFTGPAEEIMSTSFTQDSPTEPNSPACEQDSKPNVAAEILKEWDSDSDSHSSNSSSGEFIWKDGAGHETAVVPSTHFDHQRGSQPNGAEGSRGSGSGGASSGSGSGSGSGSEGDEVEFVPSSWDCRAEPSKSSLRSLEQAPPDNKKRVVFKRQKYHCVYEYPREATDLDSQSPAAYLPDLSTYCEWDPTSAEEAELGYGQLFGGPSPLDIAMYPLRAGIPFSADYEDDFFISSSARPFESLGIMSTTSQFFPGMHVKPLLEDNLEDFPAPAPPSPLPLPTPAQPATLAQTITPSLDFTTPDSGVEDITPGSTSTDEDFKTKKLTEELHCWKPVDSACSSESVSPSSPGSGEALGGLRHTRDKLKLDLPPSPHIPSPRHNRVFNFVLDKPKRHRVPDERPAEVAPTPLIMSDETPIITTSLPLQKDCEDVTIPEPTFSTFGKSYPKNADSEQKIILTDEVDEPEVKAESPVKAEQVKEGTVLDSGDEDSGIESSSKATLERNKTPTCPN